LCSNRFRKSRTSKSPNSKKNIINVDNVVIKNILLFFIFVNNIFSDEIVFYTESQIEDGFETSGAIWEAIKLGGTVTVLIIIVVILITLSYICM